MADSSACPASHGQSSPVSSKKTIVLKVGTSSLLSEDGLHPRLSMIARIAEAAVRLKEAGHRVVVVTSGAVGFGVVRQKLESRPPGIVAKQALAAIGQSALMRIYDEFFSQLGHTCAQVLLTYDCFGDRSQYLNARNTLSELLRMGVVPIVNENDTVAVQELMFGDNDSLGAQVAAVVNADWYFILTDVDAVYSGDPRTSPDAKPIRVVTDVHALRIQLGFLAPAVVPSPPVSVAATATTGASSTVPAAPAVSASTSASSSVTATPAHTPAAGTSTTGHHSKAGAGGGGSGSSKPVRSGKFGTGGMATKLVAAQLACAAGVTTVICRSSEIDHLESILAGAEVGTRFLPAALPVRKRKKWIMGLAPNGALALDAGACAAVRKERKSLLPAGIIGVSGSFDINDVVRLCDPDGVEFGRCFVNYSSSEIQKIAGKKSSEVEGVLGYIGSQFVVDRNKIVVFTRPDAASASAVAATAAVPVPVAAAPVVTATPDAATQ